MEPFELLIHGASEVLTCTGEGSAEQKLAPIAKGAVGIRDGRIAWLGTEPPVRGEIEIDARGGFVGPGFVDWRGYRPQIEAYLRAVATLARLPANRVTAALVFTTVGHIERLCLPGH